MGRANKHSNISSRTAIFCIFTAASTDVCAHWYLCPFHPSLQQHHNLALTPKMAQQMQLLRKAPAPASGSPCTEHATHAPLSRKGLGLFMPNHQAPKPPNSCTTTGGGERRPNEFEQVVLWFKPAPRCYQQCYGSPELDSCHEPSPAATIHSTWGQATALLPLLSSSKGDRLGKKPVV